MNKIKDDFTQLAYFSTDLQEIFQEKGYYTYEDLRGITPFTALDIMDSYHGGDIPLNIVEHIEGGEFYAELEVAINGTPTDLERYITEREQRTVEDTEELDIVVVEGMSVTENLIQESEYRKRLDLHRPLWNEFRLWERLNIVTLLHQNNGDAIERILKSRFASMTEEETKGFMEVIVNEFGDMDKILVL